MAVEYIDPGDFPMRLRQYKPLSEESRAVDALELGQAFRVPCRWKHQVASGNQCGGTVLCHHRARLANRSVTVTCQGGFLYVKRIA